MRYASAYIALAALTLATGLAACANGTGAESMSTQAEEQRTAVLFVERQATESPGGTAHIGARFVQYTGIPSESLPDLLGTPRLPGSVQGCAERTDPVVDTAGARAEARLLDVGRIDVRSGDRVVNLEPRQFPDLWNVVSGVIYATDDDVPDGVLHFSAPGNVQSHVDPFDVEARAPDELSQITIADQVLSPGATVTLPRRAFHVSWARGDQNDGVTLVFESGASADRPSTISCTAHDEGGFDIDAAWADRIADIAASSANVTVHRIRTRPFVAGSMDSAHVVFDLSVRGRGHTE